MLEQMGSKDFSNSVRFELQLGDIHQDMSTLVIDVNRQVALVIDTTTSEIQFDVLVVPNGIDRAVLLDDVVRVLRDVFERLIVAMVDWDRADVGSSFRRVHSCLCRNDLVSSLRHT